MMYTTTQDSPLGSLLLAADDTGLTGIWFEDGKYALEGLDPDHTEKETPVLAETRRWLEEYFSGKVPAFLPPLHPAGSPFRQAVWKLLLEIPYGQTTTYGVLAAQLAKQQGRDRMSAQAVGGAVGHNPISILIPCHRVVGTDGSLTGYAGGLERKRFLLRLEGVRVSSEK